MTNEENLSPSAHADLIHLRETFADLGITSAMKESLRNIYQLAEHEEDAALLFAAWCEKAEASKVPELANIAKTIRTRLTGILAYWRNDKITNAKMEGFNNKIRWLIRQAYGYRDEAYFKLKIYDLPNIKTEKEL